MSLPCGVNHRTAQTIYPETCRIETIRIVSLTAWPGLSFTPSARRQASIGRHADRASGAGDCRSPIASRRVKLSVVMPAQNEEGSVGATVEGVVAALEGAEIDYEVVVVNDDSEDSTEAVVAAIGESNPRVRVHRSHLERGFGNAIRAGLDVFEGDAVAIVMADASDSPADLVTYHRVLEEGWDCAFGSRFMPGAKVHDYPRLKSSSTASPTSSSGCCSATATTTPPTPSRPTGARSSRRSSRCSPTTST